MAPSAPRCNTYAGASLRRVFLCLLALCLSIESGAGPDVEPGRQPPRETESWKDLIDQRIEELESSVPAETQRPFEARKVEVSRDLFRGSPDAPVTMIMFSDYLCPYCARFEIETLPDIVRDFVESGRVRLAVREYPLTRKRKGQDGRSASHLAICAAEQGGYWEMRRLLFSDGRRLTETSIRSLASAIGLNGDDLVTCQDAQRHADRIDEVVDQAGTLGIIGVPSFLLGASGSEDPHGFEATLLVHGAQDFEYFREAIASLAPSREGQ